MASSRLSVKRTARETRVLRIIGGTWRGRRWRFAADAEVRPTPDRIRETLFNWLNTRIAGARCLDLFAGSGALGLEALSRGAAHVTFIERHPASAAALQSVLREWLPAGSSRAQVTSLDAMRFLARPPVTYDCVFLDPPFATSLAAEALTTLDAGWLAPRALIYLEQAARAALPALPEGWTVLRTKRAGEVGYHLLERSATGAGSG